MRSLMLMLVQQGRRGLAKSLSVSYGIVAAGQNKGCGEVDSVSVRTL